LCCGAKLFSRHPQPIQNPSKSHTLIVISSKTTSQIPDIARYYLVFGVAYWMAKPVKSSFFATEMPKIGSAGVKNHHLEMTSTPPQFFARADFDPVGPFLGATSSCQRYRHHVKTT